MATMEGALPLTRQERPPHLERWRLSLADGAETTLYAATYDSDRTELGIAVLERPMPLSTWCVRHGVAEAVVGGFFTRPDTEPLGELRTNGIVRPSVAFDPPWDALRSCVHTRGGLPAIARRTEISLAPRGDLLQAGPLLVRGGARVVEEGGDPEGFSSAAHQFDSDITNGRYPRAALGLAPGRIVAVACDGRADHDAGLTLVELADLLVRLGARTAINLDGGGSTSLVCGGRLVNVPRADTNVKLPVGRPVATALTFTAR